MSDTNETEAVKRARRDFRILLVDDDDDTLRLLRSILTKAGFEAVFATSNPKAALERATQTEYDVIVSDWKMPLMTGIEFLRELRQFDRCRDIPFVMLTSNRNKEHVVEAMKAGVTDYVSKNEASGALVPKLDALLLAAKSRSS